MACGMTDAYADPPMPQPFDIFCHSEMWQQVDGSWVWEAKFRYHGIWGVTMGVDPSPDIAHAKIYGRIEEAVRDRITSGLRFERYFNDAGERHK